MTEHVPDIKAATTAHSFVESYSPVCSCGWDPGGQWHERMARDAAQRHADIENAKDRESRMTEAAASDGPFLPVARLRALIRLLGNDELTPTARRQLELLCAEYEDA